MARIRVEVAYAGPEGQWLVPVELDAGASALAAVQASGIAERLPGFDPAVAKKGSGLTNMQDRIAALGGTFRIASSPGRGVAVLAEIPVSPSRPSTPEPLSAAVPEPEPAPEPVVERAPAPQTSITGDLRLP